MSSGARLPGRVVPWTCHAEWLHVMNLMYSSTENEKLKGYRIVRMWAGRGRIPAAVEATGNFVKLKMDLDHCLGDVLSPLYESLEEDEESEKDDVDPDVVYNLRLSTTMALVRFVNEMVDPGQKGAYAQPITRIAEQMGLPRNLVDLRHSGTHDELPSASLLQLALHQALDWLYYRYWLPVSNWEVSLREKCEFLLGKLDEDLGEFEAKVSSEDQGPAEQIQQRRNKIVAKALNSIDHLQLSAEVQRVFVSVVEHKYATNEVNKKLIFDCLAGWTGKDFSVKPTEPVIVEKIEITASGSSSMLDETAELMRRLAEMKRRKVEEEAPKETPESMVWKRVTEWKPCDLGSPIDFCSFVN